MNTSKHRSIFYAIAPILGIANAWAAIDSIADGSYFLAAFNAAAMLYIASRSTPPNKN